MAYAGWSCPALHRGKIKPHPVLCPSQNIGPMLSAILLEPEALDGVAGEMSVAGSGLHLGMSQQFADHGQAFPKRQRTGGKAVAEVMNSNIVKLGPCPDASPGVLQIGEVRARLLAGDDPGIVIGAGEG